MNKVLRKDESIFQSHELSLVAALVAWGFPILYINKDDPKKVTFYFSNSPQLTQSVHSFWSNTKEILPIKYFDALRQCKSRIYGG